jgi:hypothetical protein
MRLHNTAEETFVNTLVEGTKLLVANSKFTTPEKIAALKKAIAGHAQQAVLLRAQRNAVADTEMMKKIERLIKLREEAAAYLSATAKWLTNRDRSLQTLDDLPRMFAVPKWQNDQLWA